MTTLTITITSVTEQDYDGVDETTKHVCGHIDDEPCTFVHVEESTVSDATVKTNFKIKLTAAGYTWDTEA